MFDDIGSIRSRLTAGETLDGRIDTAFEVIKGFGFDALIYDYTPVPYDLDGAAARRRPWRAWLHP